MNFFLLSIFCLLCVTVYPQQTDYWTVKTGESIKDALGDSVAFRFKDFTDGFVYFKDGNISTGKLNLNLVNGEMEFISGTGDTMTVANEGTTKFIAIGNDTFYYNETAKVFVELVYGNSAAKLAKVVAFVPVDMQKVGAYGQTSSTASINSTSYFFTGGQYSRLNQNRVLLLNKKTTYFIGDFYNHFVPADKRNVRKMFSKQENAITDFLQEHKRPFANEEELKALVNLLEK